ncbi:hypothetical protein H0X10_03100 [Candidatus Saccharibacteria bacterium]|nr:hypothetical protein [Candidatus Saccharibacteria bacterium]
MDTFKINVDADGYFDALMAETYINSENRKAHLHIEVDRKQPKRLPEGMTRIVVSGALEDEVEFLQMMESVQEGRESS